MEFKIDDIKIKNQVVLAPMAGVSNPAYMKICEEMGLGYAITELISAEAVVRGNKKTLEMLNGIDQLNIPVAIQIFGSNPETMAKAAKILTNLYSVSFIDINMGCPVPKVAVRSEAGSSLLKDPKKVYEVVSRVVKEIEIPVTVKIRSGWDHQNINAIEIAQTIEKAGARAISIHPRTRSQGYSGKADWDIIRLVKENVTIPVIGNGDIKNCYDAKRMLEQTKCDAVMIGRATMGNPWIIKEIKDYLEYGIQPIEITPLEKLNMIKKHLNNLIFYKNETVAVLEMRNHIAWYLKGVPNSSELKNKIFKTRDIDQLKALIDDFIEKEYKTE